MPRLRDGAERNGQVWASRCRESSRGPTAQPVRGPTSTANSQRYTNDLGAGVRSPVKSTVRGALTGVSVQGHISTERHNRPSSGWHLSLLSENGRVLDFSRALPSAWGRFLVCYQIPAKKEKKQIFSEKNEAERGRGAQRIAPRSRPQRGGGKPRASGVRPPPRTRFRHKNLVSLAPQGFHGMCPDFGTEKVEKIVEKCCKCNKKW